jgi:hypothetical protein
MKIVHQFAANRIRLAALHQRRRLQMAFRMEREGKKRKDGDQDQTSYAETRM